MSEQTYKLEGEIIGYRVIAAMLVLALIVTASDCSGHRATVEGKDAIIKILEQRLGECKSGAAK